MSTIFSTFAAHSPVGQGLSCFCNEIVIGGDEYSAFHLFGQMLDGLLELGWVRGSEIELAKVEFHSFVREQQQVDTSGNQSRLPISSVFAFYNQPGFGSRRNSHKLVLWRFKPFQRSQDLTLVLLSDFAVDCISDEGSFRVASCLYCVAEWGCNGP